jgi:hypothetical protein
MRSLRKGLLLSLVSTLALAPAAAAAPASLADQFKKVGESINDLGNATTRVVEARKRYEDQLKRMREAARDISAIFAPDQAPASPKAKSILESLRDNANAPKLIGTPTPLAQLLLLPAKKILTPPTKLFQLGVQAKPFIAKPVIAKPFAFDPILAKIFAKPIAKPVIAPANRLASLLVPATIPAIDLDVRVRDPQGTSLYDALSFDQSGR